MASWSELPRDLLSLILGKLPLPDCIRFGSVCISWNLASKTKQFRPKPHSPWLMFFSDSDNENTARFLSLSETNRIYKIHLPDPPIRRRLCIGSSHGWLITVSESCEMHLLNPITRVQISLPPITTLPFVQVASRDDATGNITSYILIHELRKMMPWKRLIKTAPRLLSSSDMQYIFFVKAVLSAAPDETGDFVVVLMHNPVSRMAFARGGDEEWTPLRTPFKVRDIVLRGDSFYTLASDGRVHAWPISTAAGGFADLSRHVLPVGPDGFSFRPIFISKNKENDCDMPYLVNSPDGDLMIVNKELRCTMTDRYRYHMDCCQLLVMHPETRKWRHVRDMKDSVFFVGNSHSASFSATQFPELRKDCVYYTDDHEFAEMVPDIKDLNRDIGVFNMKENRAHTIDYLPPHLTWPPPIWVTPTMF